ncbi:PQQ-binding-like beta-propeller repeat protein [Oerskovia sp. NPDC057915]|uniref:outer membrane protein assembly factor BamB family protein n=1 Tax=Oerskovia sp. NPDC057915 TaxID=3346280 RepID=UPI0036D92362
MPFRRREQPRQIAFEAVDDLDDGDDAFAPRPSRPGAPSSRPAPPPDDVAPAAAVGAGTSGGADGNAPVLRDPRAHRRRLVVIGVAGALVLVLGGLTALDVARARQADALLRTAPGGVVGLTQPPEETWSVDSGETWPVFVDDRLLLGLEEGLVAHDLSTGEVSWRREELAGFLCGAGGPSAVVPSEASIVTCLGGGGPVDAFPREPSTTVAVVGSDGEVLARRDLDPSRGVSEVLPDGDLVRAVRDGSDLVMTVEDARTGEARWTRTVPQVEPGEGPAPCELTQEDGSTVEDRESIYFLSLAGVIWVAGCGVDASLSEQGEVLSSADQGFTRSLRDGRLARTSRDGRTTDVLDKDGTLLWSTQAVVTEPLATDGTAPPLLFAQGGSGFTAIDADGRELWSFARYATRVLLVTKDLTVVASYPGAVAIDNATGEEVWTWNASDSGGSSTSDVTVAFAGRGALTVVVGVEPVERTRWTSIDLADGSARWTTTIPVEAYTFMAVGGRLISAADGRITAFG